MKTIIGNIVLVVVFLVSFSAGIATDHYFLIDKEAIIKEYVGKGKIDSTLVIKQKTIQPETIKEKNIRGTVRLSKENEDEPTQSKIEFEGKNFKAFMTVESLSFVSAGIDSIIITPPAITYADSCYSIKETVIIEETWYKIVFGNNWVDYTTRLIAVLALIKTAGGFK